MRRCVFVAVLLLAACGRSPSSPSTPPASPPSGPVAIADFSGYWSGTVAYKACGGIHCSTTSDRNDPFSLRLRQSGDGVTGVFALNGSNGVLPLNGTNIEIKGNVQADGTLQLTGSETTGGIYGIRGDATFAASGLRLDPFLGLKGSLRFERRTFSGPSEGYFSSVADATIVSAARGSLDAYIADLSGTWTGLYLVKHCIDDRGGASCLPYDPNEVGVFEMKLTVAGDTASGLLGRSTANIPVSGRVLGRTIDLNGGTDNASGSRQEVPAFSATVDQFGRLHGRYTHVRVSNGVTFRAEVDLIQVVKVR